MLLRLRFSLSQTSCLASTSVNVSFTISAGCTFTGRNGKSSHARLPVLSAMPSGVTSRRIHATPTRKIHFQYLHRSFRSIWEITRYSTTPSSSATDWTATRRHVCI